MKDLNAKLSQVRHNITSTGNGPHHRSNMVDEIKVTKKETEAPSDVVNGAGKADGGKGKDKKKDTEKDKAGVQWETKQTKLTQTAKDR